MHRKVALTANRDRAGTPAPDALDDTDDERDERDDRVDTSDTIESGDEAEDVERAREDRRTAAGYPSYECARGQNEVGGRWSSIDRAMPKFCAWHIAVLIEGRRGPHVAILAAGVEAICDCGVIWGVGSIEGRGIVGIGRW